MSNLYTIYATEMVTHEISIVAESEQQARQLVEDGEGKWEINNGVGFRIDEVILEEVLDHV